MQLSYSKMLAALPLLVALNGVQGASLPPSSRARLSTALHGIDRRTVSYPPANLTCTSGCKLKTYKVKGADAAVFWSTNVDKSKVDTAFVVVHGQYRDGGDYYRMMATTLKAVQKANNYTGVPKSAVIVAPEFFSKTNDVGLYGNNTLAWSWGEWEGGGTATNPKKTSVTAFDVLDALLDEFSNFPNYPAMKRIVFIGHGGGGQLMQRYAVVGKQSRIPVRYLSGNPSSSLYFTPDRPTLPDVNKTSCPTYDSYRYGFAGYNGPDSPATLFRQYIGRDVVNIVSLKDVTAGGDQTCNATIQGGSQRRMRNLTYWRYMNLLAGTSRDVSGFPGNFSEGVTDWSAVSKGNLAHKMVIVEGAYHNLDRLLASQPGQSAIFQLDPNTIDEGWRPPSNPKNRATIRPKSTSTVRTTSSTISSARSSTTMKPSVTATAKSKSTIVKMTSSKTTVKATKSTKSASPKSTKSSGKGKGKGSGDGDNSNGDGSYDDEGYYDDSSYGGYDDDSSYGEDSSYDDSNDEGGNSNNNNGHSWGCWWWC